MQQTVLCSFLEEYDFPSDAVTQLCVARKRIDANPAQASAMKALEDSDAAQQLDYNAAHSVVRKVCAACGVDAYTGLLLFYCGLTPQLWVRYRQAGYTREMFRAVVLDLRYKAVECHTVYGVWGVFTEHWHDGFFTMQRFALGRLQFEISPLCEACVTDGVAYDKGTPVINVHIPSSGSLAPELCDTAFEQARAFFAPEYPLFMCESWLLFPPNDDILAGQKNILAFAHRFQIIKCVQTKPDIDMWRIFGVMPHAPYTDLPEITSLQRAYKQWLQQGNAPGEGIGVFTR